MAATADPQTSPQTQVPPSNPEIESQPTLTAEEESNGMGPSASLYVGELGMDQSKVFFDSLY